MNQEEETDRGYTTVTTKQEEEQVATATTQKTDNATEVKTEPSENISQKEAETLERKQRLLQKLKEDQSRIKATLDARKKQQEEQEEAIRKAQIQKAQIQNAIEAPISSIEAKKQPTPNTEANTKPTKQPEIQPQEIQKAEAITKIIQQNTNNPQNQEIENTQKENNTTMTQQQIYQQIASFIPEYNGADTPDRTNELARFLGTADSIYGTLKTDDERKTFAKLIKFKLTGDAYTRISRREIEDYETLADVLNNMYAETHSLDEMEKQFTHNKQIYGESTKNYGYRLTEALEQYKNAFKKKYKIDKLDETYAKHLNTTAVQIFKRGIDNAILKGKIATSKAANLKEIIDETEATEKMLQTTMNIQGNQRVSDEPKRPQTNEQRYHNQNIVICNYCRIPNHTWDVCRKRMNQERMNYQRQLNPGNFAYGPQPNQRPQFTMPSQMRQQYQPAFYTNRNNFPQRTGYQYNNQTTSSTNNQNRYIPYYPNTPTGQQNERNNLAPNNIQRNTYPTSNRNINYGPPKYCSHCKTTKGHTFDECRSKFYTNGNDRKKDGMDQSINNIEAQLKNLRINRIYPQPIEHNEKEEQQPQENQNGSNQQ